MKKLMTLCVVHQPSRVLLGMKKRGFGAGRWNGFGGRVESGERVEDAAKREVREEAGIEVEEIQRVGIIEFEFKGDPTILQVHVFSASNFSGKPVESEEMKPQWFSIEEIPYESMWVDDKYWLPYLLAGKKFNGYFLFEGEQKILKHKLQEADSL